MKNVIFRADRIEKSEEIKIQVEEWLAINGADTDEDDKNPTGYFNTWEDFEVTYEGKVYSSSDEELVDCDNAEGLEDGKIYTVISEETRNGITYLELREHGGLVDARLFEKCKGKPSTCVAFAYKHEFEKQLHVGGKLQNLYVLEKPWMCETTAGTKVNFSTNKVDEVEDSIEGIECISQDAYAVIAGNATYIVILQQDPRFV